MTLLKLFLSGLFSGLKNAVAWFFKEPWRIFLLSTLLFAAATWFTIGQKNDAVEKAAKWKTSAYAWKNAHDELETSYRIAQKVAADKHDENIKSLLKKQRTENEERSSSYRDRIAYVERLLSKRPSGNQGAARNGVVSGVPATPGGVIGPTEGDYTQLEAAKMAIQLDELITFVINTNAATLGDEGDRP